MTAVRSAVFVAALLAAWLAGPVLAGETASEETGAALRLGDSCVFFRGQAYTRAIDHVATEMLLACEVIARGARRGRPAERSADGDRGDAGTAAERCAGSPD